jgi:Lipocalin-like domain
MEPVTKETFMRMPIIAALIGVALAARLGLAADNDALLGAWKVVSANVIEPDGTQTEDYGKTPLGIAIFTASGHYAVEIFKSERLKFASNDKFKGTPDEYKDVSIAMSCHFGTYEANQEKGTITLKVESASFPNIVGSTRVSSFTLTGDELTWRVPPRPDGSIPVTTFRRVQ